jgi:hypothetical protein
MKYKKSTEIFEDVVKFGISLQEYEKESWINGGKVEFQINRLMKDMFL